MNADSFAAWAREGNEPIDVSDVTIQTPTGLFQAHGTLRVLRERFALALVLHGEEQLPMVTGVVLREQFWKISGLLAKELPFQAFSIVSRQKFHWTVETGSVLNADFTLDHVSLVTEEAIRDGSLQSSGRGADEFEAVPAAYHGYARLPGHRLLMSNSDDNDDAFSNTTGALKTFKGTFNDFQYILRKTDDDCECHLLSSKDCAGHTQTAFRYTFDAFLFAIAFLHGREAWPQHRRLMRGSELLEEKITPQREVAHTQLILLSNGACATGAHFGQAIRCAVNFFLCEKPEVSKVKRLLHLCRQSGSGHPDIGMLNLCSIFEGIVAALHEYSISPLPKKDDEAFTSAKEELISMARSRAAEGAHGFKRLIGFLASARAIRPEDVFRRLVKHYALPEEEMEIVLTSWKAERNLLAHGREPSDAIGDRMFRQSRLAGGINLLVAKAMGYNGKAVLSMFEDRYIQI